MPYLADDVIVTSVPSAAVQHLHVYDLSGRRLITEITDYARHMRLDRQYSDLTVSKRIGQVVIFWRWLRDRDLPVEAVSEQSLLSYRDDELRATLARKSARGDERTAKRTVNDKLVTAIEWISWLADSGRIAGTCVPARPLPEAGAKRWNAKHQRRRATQSRVLFRSTGAASRHKTAFVVDDFIVSSIHRIFQDGSGSAYVAHRNALWAEIAEVVGFRRASICSLTVDQFDRAKLEAEADPVILVSPSSQKFGYQNDFQFPVWLALRVCEFDEQYRQPMLRQKRVASTVTLNRVFLSSRDGRPMTDRAMTHIMSQAMRAAGAPKGVAGHALRAKFCNDAVVAEYEARLDTGMDTSTQAVAMAVAWRMGHRNGDSLYPYVSRMQAKEALLLPSTQKRQLVRLQEQVAELTEQLRLLNGEAP